MPLNNLDQFLQAVSERLTPEQVFTHEAHNFKPSPTRYRGGCPWHKSASGTSFYVRLDDGLSWNCPVCGVGGGPIHYLHRIRKTKELYQGVPGGDLRGDEFIQLAKELGDMAGVPFPEAQTTPEDREIARKLSSRREMLTFVMSWSKRVLESSQGESARSYMRSRGFTDEQILDEFGMGILGDVPKLAEALSKVGLLDMAIESGVIFTSSREGFGSMLSGYVIVPWNDDQGRILTLYGRWASDKPDGNKSKTTALRNPGHGKDTWLASKMSPLFLDRALKAGETNLTVVEGLLDASMAQAIGDTSAVAFVANKPSAEQVATLKRRGITSVNICLDPDQGGVSGTLNTIKAMTLAGIPTYVCPSLPGGLDPDQFIISAGQEGWATHKASKIQGFRWMAEHLLSFARGRDGSISDEEKTELIEEAKAFAAYAKGTDLEEALRAFFWGTLQEQAGIAPVSFSEIKAVAPAEVQAVAPSELPDRVAALLNGDLSPAEEVLQRIAIQKDAKLSAAQLDSYVHAVQQEELIKGARGRHQANLKDLMKASQAEIPLEQVFPKPLASAIRERSEVDRIHPSFFIQYLWGACALMIGDESRLILREVGGHPNWSEPAIIWAGIVGASGSGKSPALNAIYAPIEKIQEEYDAKYARELEEYQKALKDWKDLSKQERNTYVESDANPDRMTEPQHRILVEQAATMESLLWNASKQPAKSGTVWLLDELISLLSVDQYKAGGMGDSRAILLTAFNGGRVQISRKSGGFAIPAIRLSIAGGIQVLKAHELFNSDDSDGWNARFLLAAPPEMSDSCEWRTGTIDTYQVFSDLYESIGGAKLGDVKLGNGALSVWRDSYRSLKESLLYFREENPAYANFLAKAPSHLARLCLVLHHIEYAYESTKVNPQEIEELTMRRAWVILDYYLSQFRLLQQRGREMGRENSGLSLRIHEMAVRRLSAGKPGLTVADCASSYLAKETRKNAKDTLTAASIKEAFKLLEAEGYGTLEGRGNTLRYIPKGVSEIIPSGTPEGNPETAQDHLRVIESKSYEKAVRQVLAEPLAPAETVSAQVEYFQGDRVSIPSWGQDIWVVLSQVGETLRVMLEGTEESPVIEQVELNLLAGLV